MRYFYLLILLLFAFTKSISAQVFKWAKQTEGSANSQQYVGGLATDDHGNIYVAGGFTESIKVADSTFQSKGVFDIFLIKYNSDGEKIWSRTFGNSNRADMYSIAMDSIGNIILLGTFEGSSISFGNHVLTNNNNFEAMFLAKLDSSGNSIWAVSKTASLGAAGLDLALDKSGNIFTTGFYADQTSGGANLFITKYDPSGNTLFNFSSTGTGLEFANGITVDKDDNILLTGSFLEGELSVGGFTLQNSSLNPSSTDAFLMKLNNTGAVLWVSQINGNGSEQSFDVATDQAGNAYITGDFDQIAYFGGVKLGVDTTRIPYASDIFIVKYDANGNALWGKTSRSQQGFAWSYRITLSPWGDIYVVGFVGYQFFADNGESISACSSNANAMIIGLDPSGAVKDLCKVGGEGASRINYIVFDKNENIIVDGIFYGQASAGYNPLTLTGGSNVFVAKLAPPPWSFAGGTISSELDADCSKPLTVTLNSNCTSFPDDVTIGEVLIEISKVNSNSFFLPPHLIGRSSTNTITCQLPDTLAAGIYNIRAIANNAIISNTIEVNIKCDTTTTDHGLGDADYPVFIPNVFTPNDDGQNDLFQIVYDGPQKFTIEIYNRWGETVDIISDGTKTWNGKGYSSGIYYYRVTIGKSIYKGWLSLVR